MGAPVTGKRWGWFLPLANCLMLVANPFAALNFLTLRFPYSPRWFGILAFSSAMRLDFQCD
jgi:hypothetical protein